MYVLGEASPAFEVPVATAASGRAPIDREQFIACLPHERGAGKTFDASASPQRKRRDGTLWPAAAWTQVMVVTNDEAAKAVAMTIAHLRRRMGFALFVKPETITQLITPGGCNVSVPHLAAAAGSPYALSTSAEAPFSTIIDMYERYLADSHAVSRLSDEAKQVLLQLGKHHERCAATTDAVFTRERAGASQRQLYKVACALAKQLSAALDTAEANRLNITGASRAQPRPASRPSAHTLAVRRDRHDRVQVRHDPGAVRAVRRAIPGRRDRPPAPGQGRGRSDARGGGSGGRGGEHGRPDHGPAPGLRRRLPVQRGRVDATPRRSGDPLTLSGPPVTRSAYAAPRGCGDFWTRAPLVAVCIFRAPFR